MASSAYAGGVVEIVPSVGVGGGAIRPLRSSSVGELLSFIIAGLIA